VVYSGEVGGRGERLDCRENGERCLDVNIVVDHVDINISDVQCLDLL
jgi:hypothetical protein